MQDPIISSNLDLRFKGDRDYLHSTDLYNSIQCIVDRHGYYISKLTFRKLIKNKILFSKIKTDDYVGIVSVETSGMTSTYFITESNQRITSRYDYNEYINTSLYNFDKNSIYIEELLSDRTIIEVVVGLLKVHLDMYFIGRFVVAELSFLEKLRHCYPISLRRKRTLLRYTQYDLYQRNKKTGSIGMVRYE